VVDSRTTADGIRRRRICKDCKRRFTTYERVGSPGLKVVKRGDRKPEPFSADKLLAKLLRICRRRPVREHDLEALVSQVQAELTNIRSIDSGELARMVLTKLIVVDRISGDRFAASYTDETGQLRFDDHQPDVETIQQLALFSDDESE
jgi:transcriptional repressor NrdR